MRRPRLGFVGPNLSVHPGWVTTQGEILADLFASEGYEVRCTSSVLQPVLRLLDMARTLRSWRGEVDVVSISVFSGRAFFFAELLSRACRTWGLPHVQVLHGGGLPEMATRSPRRLRRALERADAVVSPSPFLARTASELGVEARVIPNVLDLECYDFKHRIRLSPPLDLLWLRTFHELYHPEGAIDTLAELCRRGVDARLTMAGQDRGLEAVCRRRAEEAGLQERVCFPGFLDMPGKQRELASHDVYLHTNRVDNTPVTVLEAAACGLPVVGTRVGGVPDLLGERGLLVPVEDPVAAADAVERLLAEPGLVSRCSAQGRELAESCAWPAVREAWMELFSQLYPWDQRIQDEDRA